MDELTSTCRTRWARPAQSARARSATIATNSVRDRVFPPRPARPRRRRRCLHRRIRSPHWWRPLQVGAVVDDVIGPSSSRASTNTGATVLAARSITDLPVSVEPGEDDHVHVVDDRHPDRAAVDEHLEERPPGLLYSRSASSSMSNAVIGSLSMACGSPASPSSQRRYRVAQQHRRGRVLSRPDHADDADRLIVHEHPGAEEEMGRSAWRSPRRRGNWRHPPPRNLNGVRRVPDLGKQWRPRGAPAALGDERVEVVAQPFSSSTTSAPVQTFARSRASCSALQLNLSARRLFDYLGHAAVKCCRQRSLIGSPVAGVPTMIDSDAPRVLCLLPNGSCHPTVDLPWQSFLTSGTTTRRLAVAGQLVRR